MGKHRGRAALAVFALTMGGIGAFAAPASADGDHQRVTVTLTGDGSSAKVSSHEVHPGVVKFTFTGSSKAGVSGTVVSLRHGGTVARLLTDLTTAGSQTASPAQVAAAVNELNKIVVAYGGGDTLPGQSVTDTLKLTRPGKYYVVNFNNSGAAVKLATIEAEGRTVSAGNPDFSATVTLGDESKEVITANGALPRHGTIRVTNDGDSIHLLQMTKVARGVTDADVQDEYDQIVAGQFPPTSDPAGLLSPPSVLVGSDAVSPGHASRLTYRVPKGTYLLQCFVPDDVTGLPHAFMGMHKVVVIH